MPECPSRRQLESLLQESLDSSLVTQIEAHLAECTTCQKRLDELTDAGDLVGAGADLSSVPDEVVQLLRETPNTHLDDTADVRDRKSEFDASPVMIDGFDIQEHIASGATGALYRAVDRNLGRTVALKVMHSGMARSESARARLVREARAVAAIEHPNVVSVYSVGEDQQHRPYMAMQVINGRSIGDRLQSGGPLSPTEAARLAEQAAQGLHAAHTEGLVHRDVKASNILIDDQSRNAIVVDFGLVREHDQETKLTMDGVLAGTPAYISPEQIVDPTAVDSRTDVYSLGIVLYEMLTGVVPFRGVLRMTLHQVEHADPQPPRELDDAIPADLQTICLKAIEKDPARRYQTALEFADDVHRWLNNRPILARPVGKIEKAWRWCQRNRRVSVLSALSVFAVMAACGVTIASAYRLSIADEQVREADSEARRNAEALVEQRDAAMETVRRLVFDVPARLQELPVDTTDIRKSILEIALTGLKRIGQSAEASGEVDLNTAHAMQQLGTALIDAGQIDDGEQQLQTALVLSQQLTESADASVKARLDQSIYLDLADIALERGDTEAERKYLQQSLAAARTRMSSQPEAPDAAVAAAGALNLMADFEAMHSDPSTAEKLYQESGAILTDVLEKHPDSEDALLEMENSEFGLTAADDVELSPEVDRVKRQLQADLRSLREQFEIAQTDRIVTEQLIEKMLAMARWHTAFGNSGRSEKLCDEARELLSHGSDPASPLLAAKIERQAGEAFLSTLSLKQARNAFKACSAIVEAAETDENSASKLKLEHLYAQVGLGEGFVNQGNGKKAVPYFEGVLTELETFTDRSTARVRLTASAMLGLGWCAYYESDDKTARERLTQARRHVEEFRAANAGPDLYEQLWLEITSADADELQLALDEASQETAP